jgi:3-dehydroquinate synthase
MVSKLPNYISISDNISIDLKREIDLINPDIIVVLVDENTKKSCLPLINVELSNVIEIDSGELNKTLATCSFIWQQLTQLGCSRKSLLINLGGGVIGDMGGFCAATYKRGIPFINVPTTLLSQVDASIGGKLGVDFNELKNHIGLFKEPNKVIIHSEFLKSLPLKELKSGFAEIIKHALIFDMNHWNHLKKTPFEALNWNELIETSVGIKNTVVEKDPFESGLRKILNFGHTLGHAIESHLLNTKNPLLHGEAVAIGMILESHISYQKGMTSDIECKEIQHFILAIFDLPNRLPEIEVLMSYLVQDKKNSVGKLNFSLINKIGECQYDIEVSEMEIKKSLESYNTK